MGREIHHVKVHFRKTKNGKIEAIENMTCFPDDIRKCHHTMQKILKHPLGKRVRKNFSDGDFEIVKVEKLGTYGESQYY